MSTTAWTVGGDECLVGSTCYASGEKDVTGCSACVPSQSKVAFTNGTHACKIGSLCYQQNEKNPEPTCTSAVSLPS